VEQCYKIYGVSIKGHLNFYEINWLIIDEKYSRVVTSYSIIIIYYGQKTEMHYFVIIYYACCTILFGI